MFGIGMPEITIIAMGAGIILSFLLAIFIYLLPSFIAHRREHRNTAAIIILNVLTGWIFVGWVLSLVWSCTNNCYGKGGVINERKTD